MGKIINDIQVDVSSINEPYKTFIEQTIKQANDLDIKVLLSGERGIMLDETEGTMCNGFFCDNDMVLSCACGQPFDKWFSVFIHESSHMDQWHEKDPTWTESAKEWAGVEVGLVLDLWIGKYVEATPDQITNFIAPVREVELNCERRTIQKIIDNKLPMDTEYYAQRASAYVYFYNMIGIVREWYTLGNEPYNIPVILDGMPKTLDGDYSTTPPEIVDLFLTHMFPNFKR